MSLAFALHPESFAQPYEKVGDPLAEQLARVSLWLARHRLLFPDRYGSSEPADGDELAAIERELATVEAHIVSREDATRRIGSAHPLGQVRDLLDLSRIGGDVLVALAAAELEPEIHRAYARIWGDTKQGDVAFFGELVGGRGSAREQVHANLHASGALVRHGIVRLSPDRAWASRTPDLYLRVALGGRVAAILRGSPRALPNSLTSGIHVRDGSTRFDDLVTPPGLADRIEAAIRATTLEAGRFDPLCLSGPRHSGRKALLAAALPGIPLVVVDTARLPRDAEPFEQAVREACCETVLQGGALYFDGAEALSGEGDRVLRDRLADLLANLRIRIVFSVDGAVEPYRDSFGRLRVVEVGMPDALTQTALWTRLLPSNVQLDSSVDLDSLTLHYSLPAGSIKRCVDEMVTSATLEDPRRPVITMQAAQVAIRRQLGNRFGDLAQLVSTTFKWSDLILTKDVMQRVLEVAFYAQHRDLILRQWGFERKLPYGRSLSVLLAGEPGTGKTMVTSLLAKEMGVELFRINVSRVVDKYIGETEKNLARIFDEARRGQVALLFDEADSLFSKRTEVKSSTDRYSNLAINYLLQAVESHDGIIFLTTNHEKGIDPAFRRRIRFRISFPFPDERERARLWQSMIPEEASIMPNIDWTALAHDFAMAGGAIKNAVVRAALHAAANDTPITQELLQLGGRLEFEELGGLVLPDRVPHPTTED